jgi:hypothetical protein
MHVGANLGDLMAAQGICTAPGADESGAGAAMVSKLRFVGVRLTKIGTTEKGKKRSVSASDWADGEILIGPYEDTCRSVSKFSFARGVKAHRFVLNPIRYDDITGKIIQPPSVVNAHRCRLTCPDCG